MIIIFYEKKKKKSVQFIPVKPLDHFFGQVVKEPLELALRKKETVCDEFLASFIFF